MLHQVVLATTKPVARVHSWWQVCSTCRGDNLLERFEMRHPYHPKNWKISLKWKKVKILDHKIKITARKHSHTNALPIGSQYDNRGLFTNYLWFWLKLRIRSSSDFFRVIRARSLVIIINAPVNIEFPSRLIIYLGSWRTFWWLISCLNIINRRSDLQIQAVATSDRPITF